MTDRGCNPVARRVSIWGHYVAIEGGLLSNVCLLVAKRVEPISDRIEWGH